MDFSIASILALDGATNGAVYALLALATVLVFAVTRIIFIPQGEFVAFGALTLALFQRGNAARLPLRDKPAAGALLLELPANRLPKASATLSLGPLSEVLGYHIAQASVTTVGLFERHVGQPFGLRKVEYSLLMLILANGPLSPKKLAQELALSAPNLTLLLDRLQERGLLRRERSQVDRRSQNVVLTDEGLRTAQASAAAALPMEQGLSDRLSRAEHAMLIELLRKVAGRRSGGFNRSAADHNRLDPRARVMVKIEKGGWVYPK